MAAVTFLRVLTMRCPEVELEREVRRKAFETQLGEASIRAHTNKKQRLRRTTGHLGIVFSGSRKDCWL